MVLDYSEQHHHSGFEEEIVLKVGEELVVKVEENGSTGYSWEVEKLPLYFNRTDGDGKLKSDYEDDPNLDSSLVGGGCTRLFRFSATQPCQDTLLLVNRRVWMRGRDDDDPVYGKVIVKVS